LINKWQTELLGGSIGGDRRRIAVTPGRAHGDSRVRAILQDIVQIIDPGLLDGLDPNQEMIIPLQSYCPRFSP
jgi:hypothetical protein